MPLYEYQCDGCGAVFEKMQKFADAPLTVHEDGCGGPVHRLLSAPAFQFKGSGWYVTDYARGNSKGGAESKPAKDAAKSSETKSTESAKPAATPAPASPSPDK